MALSPIDMVVIGIEQNDTEKYTYIENNFKGGINKYDKYDSGITMVIYRKHY